MVLKQSMMDAAGKINGPTDRKLRVYDFDDMAAAAAARKTGTILGLLRVGIS